MFILLLMKTKSKSHWVLEIENFMHHLSLKATTRGAGEGVPDDVREPGRIFSG